MNRLNILIIASFVSIFCAQAQDVITFRNAEQIKAKVTEISPSEIKYKRFDNLDGPTITVLRSEVFAITYENGRRDIINPFTATESGASQARQNAGSSGNEASSRQGKAAIGVRAGLNISKFGGDVENTTKTGIQLGLAANFFLNENFSFQSGLLFSQLGCTTEGKNNYNETVISKLTLNYIQLPLDFQYKTGTLFFQAGAYLGYGIGVKIMDNDLPSYNGKMNKEDAFDFGLGFGIGFDFGKIQTVASYNVGLAKSKHGGNNEVTNNGFAFTITYLFGR